MLYGANRRQALPIFLTQLGSRVFFLGLLYAFNSSYGEIIVHVFHLKEFKQRASKLA